MLSRPLFLMTDPEHFGVIYQINPWMRPDAWHADAQAGCAAARASSAALGKALASTGAIVETLPAVSGLPDLVFPANAAVVLDGRVMPARFRHPERQGEEPIFRAAFQVLQARGLVREIVDLAQDVIQEGAGDCIWDEERGLFWAGYGQRSSANSIPAIEAGFGKPVVGLQLASERFYHLDTCFCPLSEGKLLFYPPAFTSEALAKIHALVSPQDRIEASQDEADAFCVNAVCLGHHLIMAKAPASLRTKLERLGYRLSEIDLAPFILSGGGAYCMTLRLDRRSDWAATKRAAE
jgi:N-dimethylarginine dimethylaminohydrolase